MDGWMDKSKFLSILLFKKKKIKHKQTNPETEILNRELKSHIKIFIHSNRMREELEERDIKQHTEEGNMKIPE